MYYIPCKQPIFLHEILKTFHNFILPSIPRSKTVHAVKTIIKIKIHKPAQLLFCYRSHCLAVYSRPCTINRCKFFAEGNTAVPSRLLKPPHCVITLGTKKGVKRNMRATYHWWTWHLYARSFYRKSNILNGMAEPLLSSQYKSQRRKKIPPIGSLDSRRR